MRYAIFAVFMMLTVPAHAQTVETIIDLDVLGWGELDLPKAVDTDGDTDTREWLVRPLSQWSGQPMYRVAAIRDGRVCAGPWFHVAPDPTLPLFVDVSLQLVGRTHKLVIRQGANPKVTIMTLDTPSCP